MKKRIAISSDHAGINMKDAIIPWLRSQEMYEIKDYGCFTTESVDYPDFAHVVARAVADREFDYGLLLCGSANGMAMSANKHAAVRAAICWNEELSSLARQHNDANVLCLPARFITTDLAKKIVYRFFQSSFEGGRHEKRVRKIHG